MENKFLTGISRIDSWIKMHLTSFVKKGGNLSHQEIEHIIDYLKSNDSPKRIARMGVNQALDQSKKWTKTLNDRNSKKMVDIEDQVEVLKEYGNGYRWVKLISEDSFIREGVLMKHCVATYSNREDSRIYSLRDKNNIPHCTIEHTKITDCINQIKGGANSEVKQKYVPFVIDFLNSISWNILSSYDLVNLNAYLVLRNNKKTLSKIEDLKENDEFLSESATFSELESHILPKKLFFKKLIIKNSNLENGIPKGWEYEYLLLIKTKAKESLIKSKKIELFDSILNIEKLEDLDKIIISKSSLDAEFVSSKKGVITNDSIINVLDCKIKDLIIEKSRISDKSIIEASFLTLVDILGKRNFNKIFKKFKIHKYLEMKGNFPDKIIFPDLCIQSLHVSNSNIKKIPSNVKSEKIFYIENIQLIEGQIKNVYKA